MKRYEFSDRIEFGKYEGLTIKQIYQGTLHIESTLIQNYLTKILNPEDSYWLSFYFGIQAEIIEEFKVSNNKIKIVGEIFDNNKPLTDTNRVSFKNLETELSAYIYQHFRSTFLGILEHITSFNKNQACPVQLGGDPEYLEWCIRSVENFDIETASKSYLETLSVARLRGFDILYVGKDTYEYQPDFIIDQYKFP